MIISWREKAHKKCLITAVFFNCQEPTVCFRLILPWLIEWGFLLYRQYFSYLTANFLCGKYTDSKFIMINSKLCGPNDKCFYLTNQDRTHAMYMIHIIKSSNLLTCYANAPFFISWFKVLTIRFLFLIKAFILKLLNNYLY